MEYRNKTEIVALILEIASNGANKTKIMYDVFLSYTQVNKYLGLLERYNLIKFNKKTRQYTIMEKGKKYLTGYHEIIKLLSEAQEKKNFSEIKKTH